MSAIAEPGIGARVGRALLFARRLPWPLYPLALWSLARAIIVGWGIVVRAALPSAAVFFSGRDWPLRLFVHWDANYFIGIAQEGYFGPNSQSLWAAFFPGFPVAGRLVAEALTGGRVSPTAITAGLTLVSAAGSMLAAILLFRIVAAGSGRRVALGATALLVAGPYSFVLLAPYSEALFLAAALLAWWAASSGRWMLAGLALAVASATRINGLFIVPAVALLYLLCRRRTGEPWRARSLGVLALGSCGVAGYFSWLWLRTGNLFAWSAAEASGWKRRTVWPWTSLCNTVNLAERKNFSERLEYSLDLVFAAVIVVGLVVLLWRRAWPEAVLVGTTAACMMTSIDYISIARGALLLFPLPVLVAGTLRSRHRWIFWAALLVGVALLLVNTAQFVQGRWAD